MADVQDPRLQIVNAIAELTRSMADITEVLGSAIAGLLEEIHKFRTSIERRVADIDYNNRARALNRSVSKPDHIIRQLKNIVYHHPIALPRTLGDLHALPTHDVVRFLRELGEVPRGSDDQLKTQLIECIGIGT
ncbi:hypothetical protein F5B21DRAFT_507125 [Xylaria acuta]|nr:hypothetical protein F5B21DRAFT_507125 [Xylaria acuta]